MEIVCTMEWGDHTSVALVGQPQDSLNLKDQPYTGDTPLSYAYLRLILGAPPKKKHRTLGILPYPSLILGLS